MSESFHITELRVSGFKRIEAMRIDIDTGKPLVISGTNAAGKSSVIDSIFFALTGNGADRPIHDGMTKAHVSLKIEGQEQKFEIERTVTAKGGASLKVTDGEGKQVPKAQTFVNGLFSEHTIDPLGFLSMKPKEQAETLKRITGLSDVIAALTAKEQEQMELRKTQNATVTSLENQLDAIPAPTGNIPDEEVDLVALSNRLNMLNGLNVAFIEADRKMRDAIASRDRVSDYIARLEKDLQEAKNDLQGWQKAAEEASIERTTAAAAHEEGSKEAEKIRADLQNSQEINRMVQTKKRRKDLGKKLSDASVLADQMTAKIEGIRAEKLAAITNAKLPINGLSFNEDGISYKGTPLRDLNTAEQIRVCCAIAMAEKPALRIIQVKEAALVSKANFRVLCELAAENGFDVVAEHFSETPIDGAIHIVDGAIA